MKKNETQPNIIELVVHVARRKLHNLKKKMLLIYIEILLSMLIEHYQFPESTALPRLHTNECHKTNRTVETTITH